MPSNRRPIRFRRVAQCHRRGPFHGMWLRPNSDAVSGASQSRRSRERSDQSFPFHLVGTRWTCRCGLGRWCSSLGDMIRMKSQARRSAPRYSQRSCPMFFANFAGPLGGSSASLRDGGGCGRLVQRLLIVPCRKLLRRWALCPKKATLCFLHARNRSATGRGAFAHEFHGDTPEVDA